MANLILILLLTFPVWAQTGARAIKQKFCEDRLSNVNSMQTFLGSIVNQLARSNGGGLINGGVCWWHSRFTRNAAYLVRFRPDLPAPTRQEAERIILHIRQARGIIEIPGFRNLSDFSTEYYREIQSRLERWQRTDGIGRFQWINGLEGSWEVSPEELQATMDDTYRRVSQGEVVYQMLQKPGITAHAWLVLGMRPTGYGYELRVHDSIFSAKEQYSYIQGSRSMIGENGRFVPYTQQTNEERELKRKLRHECREYLAR